jgi:4-hydroxy-3-methylbut-2-enyl diphosphate reductase
MITAHGASDRLIDHVRQRGHQVVEATCPLVRFAHRSVQRLVKEGCHPVIIGIRDHVEVRGLTGDLAAFDVVLTEADVDALPEHSKFGVACQTTQPLDRVQRLVLRLRRRFPKSEVRFVDTVCQPTKLRQSAATELARRSDVVVVIGGANSNNTRELVGRCSQQCRRVHHVQTAEDLQADWFEFGDLVGLTAGTSTPDEIIDAVEQRLEAFSRGLGSSREAREMEEAHHALAHS